MQAPTGVAALGMPTSVPAFWRVMLSQEVTDTPPVHTAKCDYAIVRDDASVAPETGLASRSAAERDLLKQRLCSTTFKCVKFRRIKVGEADFNPSVGICRLPNAEAVAVPYVAYQALKFLPCD